MTGMLIGLGLDVLSRLMAKTVRLLQFEGSMGHTFFYSYMYIKQNVVHLTTERLISHVSLNHNYSGVIIIVVIYTKNNCLYN